MTLRSQSKRNVSHRSTQKLVPERITAVLFVMQLGPCLCRVHILIVYQPRLRPRIRRVTVRDLSIRRVWSWNQSPADTEERLYQGSINRLVDKMWSLCTMGYSSHAEEGSSGHTNHRVKEAGRKGTRTLDDSVYTTCNRKQVWSGSRLVVAWGRRAEGGNGGVTADGCDGYRPLLGGIKCS